MSVSSEDLFGQILGENDHRLWRVLRAYVEEAKKGLDFGLVTCVGSDELSYRKGISISQYLPT